MKVFISWSGDLGKVLAELLHRWLPNVVQAVEPYFSQSDIAKGARWSADIAGELDSSQVGLLVITRDVLDAPWILFEAGALSKNVGHAKVAPILFDVEPGDLTGPLAQFQSTRFEKAEVKRLLRMINSELGDSSLADDVLDRAFDKWWPELEQDTVKLLSEANKTGSTSDKRSDRAILEEVLAFQRHLADRMEQATKRTEDLRVQAEDWRAVVGREARLTEKGLRSRLEAGESLAGANLMELNLSGIDFSGAVLRGANLVRANLTEAWLINANLEGANLEGGILDGADFTGADISRTNLWRARMNAVRNLDKVATMELANFYRVEGLSRKDRDTVSRQNTVSLRDYPSFFSYFRSLGMTDAQMGELFLWSAHSYFVDAGVSLMTKVRDDLPDGRERENR